MDSGAINIKMHRLLQRQVSKFLDEKKFDINSLEDFITAVNNAYHGFEEDHRQLERTLEVSSNELFKANAELRETKQNLEKIIEERTREIVVQSRILDSMAANMPISIYSLDAEGNFVSCKGKALSPIKENTDGSIISHSIYDIMYGKKDEIRSAYEGNVVHFTWSVNHNYQEYYFENFIFPDELNPEASMVGFAIDVTKDKQRENKLQESYDSLERINGELDQYAHIVSHDLKAPLRAINNLSTWIEEDLGEIVNESAKKNFEMMRGRIHRMEMLINGILEYSRAGRQHSKPEVFNTYEMVKDIVSVLSPSEDYKFEIQQDMPEIESDRLKIEQVFSNFISNAIKYNNNLQPEIKIGFKESTTRYTFFVQDNGPGIEPEYHEKVFIIFQTLNARDKVESTGVGLAIVKKIIEETGGNVWIESELGKGSTFFFTVPKLR